MGLPRVDRAARLRRAGRDASWPALAALVAACSGAGETPSGYTDVAYECERGAPVSVRYFTDQELAELTLGDDVLRLPQQRTASGFHYTNGRTGIRGKGDEIMLEIGRMAPIRCTAK